MRLVQEASMETLHGTEMLRERATLASALGLITVLCFPFAGVGTSRGKVLLRSFLQSSQQLTRSCPAPLVLVLGY